MDHRVSKDMISSGMTPSGEKTQADLGKTQYGSAPSPNRLMDAYQSMYQDQKEETLKEGDGLYANIHKKRKSGRKMRNKGDKGSPSSQDFANAAKTAREDTDLLVAYQSIYADTFEEGKIPAGLQAYLDKKKGKKKDDDDNGDEKKGKKGKKSKGGKPDFLDLDKDGDKKEPMKKASKEMKEGYGTAAKVALKAAKPVAKKVGKFLKNNAGNITNAGLTGLTVASFLPRPQPKDTKEEKEQVNEFLGTAIGGTVGTALGGPVGGLVGGAAGAVTGAIAKKATGMVKNKVKKPIVSSNIGQNKNISADVDLFDIIKGTLLDEGLSEKEVREIMLSLTPEEIIVETGLSANLLKRAAKGAEAARGKAAVAGNTELAKKKLVQSAKFSDAMKQKNQAASRAENMRKPTQYDRPVSRPQPDPTKPYPGTPR